MLETLNLFHLKSHIPSIVTGPKKKKGALLSGPLMYLFSMHSESPLVSVWCHNFA